MNTDETTNTLDTESAIPAPVEAPEAASVATPEETPIQDANGNVVQASVQTGEMTVEAVQDGNDAITTEPVENAGGSESTIGDTTAAPITPAASTAATSEAANADDTGVEKTVTVKKYRVIGPINIMDGQGQVQGSYPVNSIHAFTTDIGDVYLEKELVEEVIEE